MVRQNNRQTSARSHPRKIAVSSACAKPSSIERTIDPLVHRYNEQRHHAKQRGIAWKLLYWEWLQIWQDSGHLPERGHKGGQWVMARNGDKGAYEAGNIKIVPCEKNNSDACLGRWAGHKNRYGRKNANPLSR
jgi:hypothetical protein